MKKLIATTLVVATAALYALAGSEHASVSLAPIAVTQPGDSTIVHAFEAHADGVPVTGEGQVMKVLGDDDEGSRHQRFIVRLASGQRILIAHNIDLAPRVSPLREGDTVSFRGEYAWNPKGGVVHWTHHDPAGRHAAGWIRHEGQVFQ